MQIESYYETGPTSSSSSAGVGDVVVSGMQDLRCYSASYATSGRPTHTSSAQPQEPKFKKGKSTNRSVSKTRSFNDPELQRKRRVTSYKVYAMEGKVKGFLRKSFRWLKERCPRVVYSW